MRVNEDGEQIQESTVAQTPSPEAQQQQPAQSQETPSWVGKPWYESFSTFEEFQRAQAGYYYSQVRNPATPLGQFAREQYAGGESLRAEQAARAPPASYGYNVPANTVTTVDERGISTPPGSQSQPAPYTPPEGNNGLIRVRGRNYTTGEPMPVEIVDPGTRYEYGIVDERNPGIPAARPMPLDGGGLNYLKSAAYDTEKQEVILQSFYAGQSRDKLTSMYGAQAADSAMQWQQEHAIGSTGVLADRRTGVEFSKADIVVAANIRTALTSQALAENAIAVSERARNQNIPESGLASGKLEPPTSIGPVRTEYKEASMIPVVGTDFDFAGRRYKDVGAVSLINLGITAADRANRFIDSGVGLVRGVPVVGEVAAFSGGLFKAGVGVVTGVPVIGGAVGSLIEMGVQDYASGNLYKTKEGQGSVLPSGPIKAMETYLPQIPGMIVAGFAPDFSRDPAMGLGEAAGNAAFIWTGLKGSGIVKGRGVDLGVVKIGDTTGSEALTGVNRGMIGKAMDSVRIDAASTTLKATTRGRYNDIIDAAVGTIKTTDKIDYRNPAAPDLTRTGVITSQDAPVFETVINAAPNEMNRGYGGITLNQMKYETPRPTHDIDLMGANAAEVTQRIGADLSARYPGEVSVEGNTINFRGQKIFDVHDPSTDEGTVSTFLYYNIRKNQIYRAGGDYAGGISAEDLTFGLARKSNAIVTDVVEQKGYRLPKDLFDYVTISRELSMTAPKAQGDVLLKNVDVMLKTTFETESGPMKGIDIYRAMEKEYFGEGSARGAGSTGSRPIDVYVRSPSPKARAFTPEYGALSASEVASMSTASISPGITKSPSISMGPGIQSKSPSIGPSIKPYIPPSGRIPGYDSPSPLSYSPASPSPPPASPSPSHSPPYDIPSMSSVSPSVSPSPLPRSFGSYPGYNDNNSGAPSAIMTMPSMGKAYKQLVVSPFTTGASGKRRKKK